MEQLPVFLLVYPQTVDTSMCQECVGMWILVCAYCVCVYVCVCVCVCVCVGHRYKKVRGECMCVIVCLIDEALVIVGHVVGVCVHVCRVCV